LCGFWSWDRGGVTVKQLDRLIDVEIHARLHDAPDRFAKEKEELTRARRCDEGTVEGVFAGECEYLVAQHARPCGVFAAGRVHCYDLPQYG
jgi:hypothetical protein